MIKKIIIIFCLIVFSASLPCIAENYTSDNIYLAYNSASSLKRELDSYEREIKSNESKIRKIKYSKKLSSREKRAKISRLESRNRLLKRKISRIKSEYLRAIS